MMSQVSSTNERSSTLKTLHVIRRAGLKAKLPPRELDTLRAMLVAFEWGNERICGKVSISRLAREMRRDRGSIGESVRELITLGILVECKPARRGLASTLELHLEHIENRMSLMPKPTDDPSTACRPTPHPPADHTFTTRMPTSPPPADSADNIPITPIKQSSSSRVDPFFISKAVDQYIAGHLDSIKNPIAYRKSILKKPNPEILSLAKGLMEKEARKSAQVRINEADSKSIEIIRKLDVQKLGILFLDHLKNDEDRGERLIQSICSSFCITPQNLPEQIGKCLVFNDRTKVECHRVAAIARLAIAHYQLVELFETTGSGQSNYPRLIRSASKERVSP